MCFSIVIPMLNEESNISNLIEEIDKALKNFKEFEIIIVDDGSIDKSTISVKESQSRSKITLLSNNRNMGQSYSITKGIKNAKHNKIITIDADMQNNPMDIPKMIKIYNNNETVKLLGGIRKNRKDTMIKKITSKIANKFRSLVLQDNCEDTGCSLKVFDRQIYLSFPFFDGMHRFLPSLFKGFGCMTMFIDVDHRSRKFGKSNYDTIGRLFRGIRDIIKVVIIIKKFKRTRD